MFARCSMYHTINIGISIHVNACITCPTVEFKFIWAFLFKYCVGVLMSILTISCDKSQVWVTCSLFLPVNIQLPYAVCLFYISYDYFCTAISNKVLVMNQFFCYACLLSKYMTFSNLWNASINIFVLNGVTTLRQKAHSSTHLQCNWK